MSVRCRGVAGAPCSFLRVEAVSNTISVDNLESAGLEDVRHGAVRPQNAARSQNPMSATTHSRQGTLSRTRRSSLNLFDDPLSSHLAYEKGSTPNTARTCSCLLLVMPPW